MTRNQGMDQKLYSTGPDEVARLRSLLKEREDEIALLNETAAAVSSELDLEKVFQLISQKAQGLIQSETLLIPLLDESCEQYTYRAGCGKNAEEIVGESLPLDFGVCGWVWRHKRPWWRGVLDELDEAEKNRWEKEAGSVILVPLFGKKHFLGGIAGINKIGGSDFTRRDLDMLTLFANHVSFAIENATYYDQLIAANRKAEHYQHKLEKLNTELEQKVRKRTAELEQANNHLKHMAMHDPLTGLPNRALLHDRLHYSMSRARRYKTTLTVMVMDLDRFKNINDTLGHHAGDLLLKTIADRLAGLLRNSDTVSRLGGDEFAVILPDTDIESAKIVCEKINAVIEQPVDYDGQTLKTAASIGIAAYPQHGDDVSELIKCADIAMYAAKGAEPGFSVYSPEQDK